MSSSASNLSVALLRRLLKALSAASTPVPLAQWIAEVDRAYQSPPLAASTRSRVLQAVRLALELAGDAATTAGLTPELLGRMAAHLDRPGVRSATANGLLRGLRAACSLAEARGWLDVSPFAAWSGWLPDDPEPLKSRHHPRADVARVLAHLEARSADWEGHRLYALAMTWAYAGLRRNEALRLARADVDCPGRAVTVRRPPGRRLKTRRSAAVVPMPEVLADCLAGWLPRVDGLDWAFPNLGRTGPWLGGRGGRRAADRLRDEAAAAGVKGLTPHTLRHSLPTHLRTTHGLDPAQVQLILRHSTQQTQVHYVHRDRAALAELVRGVDYSAG